MTRDEFYATIGKEVVVRSVLAAPTPAFLYFRQLVRKRHADLAGCLPPSFHIYYAVKANPSPALLLELSALGVGADVASLGELTAALCHGIAADRIEFSGPGKREPELTAAVRQGISSINAESLSELESIVRISRQLGVKANVGVRINPRRSADEAGLRMSGDTQFGIPENQVADALNFIRVHADAASFTGLHVHAGSQILSSVALIQNFRSILELSLETADLGVLPIRKINFGGGWGIRYFPSHTDLDLEQMAVGLSELFSEARYSSLSEIRHIVEPGRFLVGESGLYVTRVSYQKPGARRQYLIVDGGMHQNYLLAGGMGQVIRRNFELDVVSADSESQGLPSAYDIAGCLCTPQDVLASDYHCERPVHVGDRIVFFNSGAYGVTASPVNFLGHEPPAELMV